MKMSYAQESGNWHSTDTLNASCEHHAFPFKSQSSFPYFIGSKFARTQEMSDSVFHCLAATRSACLKRMPGSFTRECNANVEVFGACTDVSLVCM